MRCCWGMSHQEHTQLSQFNALLLGHVTSGAHTIVTIASVEILTYRVGGSAALMEAVDYGYVSEIFLAGDSPICRPLRPTGVTHVLTGENH